MREKVTLGVNLDIVLHAAIFFVMVKLSNSVFLAEYYYYALFLVPVFPF